MGTKLKKTPVGDKFVYEYMSEHGCRLGGEQSGHVIFSKYATTGDGILTSLKVMEVIMAKKTTLAKLVEPMKIYPQYLLNIKVKDKNKAQSDADVLGAVKLAEDKLNGAGRILYRASGTEPLIRIMVEAESEELCKNYAEEIASVLREKGHVSK